MHTIKNDSLSDELQAVGRKLILWSHLMRADESYKTKIYKELDTVNENVLKLKNSLSQ